MGFFDSLANIARVVAPFTGPYMPFVLAGAELADAADTSDGDRGTIVGAFTGESPAGGSSVTQLASIFASGSGTSTSNLGTLFSGDNEAGLNALLKSTATSSGSTRIAPN
ncbi:MAG: hypothetical protein ACRCWO_12155 [Bosea sp. (in: a-proteobacteria)]